MFLQRKRNEMIKARNPNIGKYSKILFKTWLRLAATTTTNFFFLKLIVQAWKPILIFVDFLHHLCFNQAGIIEAIHPAKCKRRQSGNHVYEDDVGEKLWNCDCEIMCSVPEGNAWKSLVLFMMPADVSGLGIRKFCPSGERLGFARSAFNIG